MVFGGSLIWLMFVELTGLYFLIVSTFYVSLYVRVIFLASELASHEFFIAPDLFLLLNLYTI